MPETRRTDPLNIPPLGITENQDGQTWMYEISEVLNGRVRRQPFINRITDAKVLEQGLSAFFICDKEGNARFVLDINSYPYLGPDYQLIAPKGIIAGTRQINNTHAMRAYQNTPQNIPNAIGTIQVYSNVPIDQDGAFNAGTGVWTPKVPGLYSVGAAVGFPAAAMVAGSYISVGIALNGGTLIASATHHINTPDDAVVHTATLVQMNGTTDTLSVAAFQNTGAAKNTFGVQYANYFYGFKED